MPTVLIHHHEIALKRGNHPLFLHHLARNLEGATQDLGSAHEAEARG